MARKKVKLAWIANESARKATFKKRRKGLMKKVRELSVLCDVEACAVVYAAPDEMAQLAVEVWPPEAEAMRLLQRFKSIPEMEKTKKMMNQESFLRHLIAKLQEQLHKQEKENREMETRLFMYRALASGHEALHAMTIQDVTCLDWLVEVKVKAVQERLDLLLIKGRMPVVLPPPPKVEQDVEKEKVAVTASAATAAMRLSTIEEEIQAQEWFMRAMMTTNPPQPQPQPQPQENINMAAGFMGEGLNLMQMQMQMQPQYVNDHYGMDSFLDSLFSH